MSDLVVAKRGEPVTNTQIIAHELGAKHADLIVTLEKLIKQNESLVNLRGHGSYHTTNFYYRPVVLHTKKNKPFNGYEMDEPSFSLLIMQLGRYEKAAIIQRHFIDAFFKMRTALTRRSNTEWLKTREIGKQARLGCTDTIKDFIEYAKKQGASSGANYYYANLTKAEYKALGLMRHEKPKTRDMLDQMELQHLIVAEGMLKRLISKEMAEGEHYKVIYHKCKECLERYSSSLIIF